MIFVSTGGFNNITAIDAIKTLSNYKITSFELSGGIYSSKLSSDLKKLDNNYSFIVHNYFPPPKKPFVLNLASLDDEIFLRTVNHIKDSISLASNLKSQYYSFHAGFLVDPKVSELGKTVQKRKLFNKKESLQRFLYALKSLSKFALEKNVELLIENNVLNKSNLEKFGKNPLLMVDFDDTEYILNNIDDNVHLLIDVAHLKVSANTLKFDPFEYLKVFKDYTKGYHLSDNNGLSDSNSQFLNDSWFWPHIRKDLNYYSIEVYNPNPEILLSQLQMAKKIIIEQD